MNRQVTGSVVRLGLLPDIQPLMDVQVRDTVIRVGRDGGPPNPRGLPLLFERVQKILDAAT